MKRTTVVDITVDKHLPSTLAADQWRNFRKLAGGARGFDVLGFDGNFVPKQPAGVFPAAQDEFCIVLGRVHDCLLDVDVDRSLFLFPLILRGREGEGEMPYQRCT